MKNGLGPKKSACVKKHGVNSLCILLHFEKWATPKTDKKLHVSKRRCKEKFLCLFFFAFFYRLVGIRSGKPDPTRI